MNKNCYRYFDLCEVQCFSLNPSSFSFLFLLTHHLNKSHAIHSTVENVFWKIGFFILTDTPQSSVYLKLYIMRIFQFQYPSTAIRTKNNFRDNGLEFSSKFSVKHGNLTLPDLVCIHYLKKFPVIQSFITSFLITVIGDSYNEILIVFFFDCENKTIRKFANNEKLVFFFLQSF